MHINDDNTLEDIGGVIWCLESDLECEAPEFPLPPRFDELIARIELKLCKNTNRIRHNWFTTALEHAADARCAFASGDYKTSGDQLRKCWEYLEQGNKAHRRKTTFIVAADGTAYSTEPRQTSASAPPAPADAPEGDSH